MDNNKLIFVIGGLAFGGAERVICNLANSFFDNGEDVMLIALHDMGVAYNLNDGIQLVNGLEGKTLTKALALRDILKNEKNSTVISFMTHINIFTLICNLGLTSKVFVSERSNPYVVPKQLARKLLRKVVYPLARGLVFQTNEAKGYFSNQIQKKSIVIPNPVFVEVPPLDYSLRKNKIVNVGRLIKSKNQEALIRAFKKVQERNTNFNFTLEIYGEGPEKENLKKIIKDLKLKEYVKLKGVSNNLHKEIQDAKIFILNSDYEGMPNALMEAMALGIPSISTDCPIGGPKSLINHNENGLLIPTKDDGELVNSIELLINDKLLWKKIARESVKLKEKLSMEKITLQWKSFLTQLK